MTAAPTPGQLDWPAFLAAVRRSGLLTEEQFARATADLPADARVPGPAAAHLVRAGILTRYQADRLLAGKSDGFHLGQYVLLDPLGKGAVGHAFRARHRTMNRLVVVEILPPGRDQTAAVREAFHREARAAARLTHPNLVTLLDANAAGDRLYFVLEYVEGATLDFVVRDRGRLPVPRACEVARQAALGLAHAHEKGMAHGGLSPAAVVVGHAPDTPVVKVLNVGLSRLAQFAARTTDLHAAAAAAEYLAPEQVTGSGPADPACDFYSLGCTLYFLLAGHPPRPASGDVLLHQMGDVVPVEAARPDVPPPVAALVCGLMAKDPAARPPSMAEVAEWLAPFAGPVATVSSPLFSLPPAAPASPFAGLDDEPTLPTLGDGDVTSITTRSPRPRKPGTPVGTMVGLLLLAAAIIAGVGAAVVMVMRSVGK